MISINLIKERMEAGERRQVKTKPEVWITILEVLTKDDIPEMLNPNRFDIKASRARCEVEVKGTHTQIVQELGAEIALKLMEKVNIHGKLSVGGKQANELFGNDRSASPKARQVSPTSSLSLIEVKERADVPDRIGSGRVEWDRGEQSKSFEVTACFDMARTVDEEVAVVVRALECLVNGSTSLLTNENLKSYVSETLNFQASEIFIDTPWQPSVKKDAAALSTK